MASPARREDSRPSRRPGREGGRPWRAARGGHPWRPGRAGVRRDLEALIAWRPGRVGTRPRFDRPSPRRAARAAWCPWRAGRTAGRPCPGARRGRVDILWRPGMAVARRGREAFIARRLRGHSTRCASRASWRPWRAGRAGRRPRLLGQRGVLSPARDGDGWPSSAPRDSGRAPCRPGEREAVLGARREWPATLGAPGGRARGEAGWCCRRPVRVGTCLAVPRVWRGRAC